MKYNPQRLKTLLPQNHLGAAYHQLMNDYGQYPSPEEEWHGSVCALLIDNGLVLIKRSSTMPSHAGQIAMLGGMRRSVEKTPWETAAREFSEETSIKSHELDFLGYLPMVYTAFSKRVIPCLAFYQDSKESFFQKAKSNGEWNYLIWVPLQSLVEEKNWEYGLRKGLESTSQLLFFALSLENGSEYSLPDSAKQDILWGASARMVWDFMRIAQHGQ